MVSGKLKFYFIYLLIAIRYGKLCQRIPIRLRNSKRIFKLNEAIKYDHFLFNDIDKCE